MALEKGTFARRKAQKLARDGEIATAIEEMRLLVREAETDPYDHVYLGDLLMREGRPQEALDAWMEAVQSYERAGLNRNAIAVGKKVLRLDHGRVAVHRTLGELYCREGLLGEAMPHFLHWLDTVKGKACFSEEFLATIERAGSAVGLQVEAALRVSEHYLRAGHPDRAALMLHGLADKVQTAGSPEIASELRERAQAAERTHEEQEAAAAALTGGGVMSPEDASPGANAGAGRSREALAPPDALTVEVPISRRDGGTGGAQADPFPDLIAIGPADDGPAEMQTSPSARPSTEPLVEPLVGPSVALPDGPCDEPRVELLRERPPEPLFPPPVEVSHELPTVGSAAGVAEPSVAFATGLGTALPSEPLAESPPEASAFLIERFPVGGSGSKPSARGRTGPGGADGPASDGALDDDQAEIETVAAEAPGDDDERIWDLDAEDEALRTDPRALDCADGSIDSSGMGAGSSWLTFSESTELTPGPSRPSLTLVPDSAGSEAPHSGAHSAQLDPDDVPWAPSVTPRSLVDLAEAAYGSGQWAEARGLYDRAAHEVPLEPMVLRRLVEIARKLEDSAAEVHYLEQLGDAWIEAGVMEEALEAFLDVLRIDPDCCTARRRLSRFREMGVPGAERIPEATRESVQGVLESAGARMSVRDDPISAIQSDEWIDLGALIEEFRDGVKNQIAGDDAPGHYDLAVSHHGMELFEEAVEELDAVLACPGLAVEMELHARELRGVCLLALRRHREAVHEFRTALERPVPDKESRCSILYHLGVALESAEEWREAAEIFDRVQDELPGFLDAEARQSACEARANGIDPGACAA
jgi:tetratricopeptide (TPR) repeat protein